ncbi:hypothetical protein GQ44DRAFT_823792 [Phaeosphaeriaceae sp. PMI808]|nr:hypothetical protein GQ44DRAFT_823792 [Phaeosphaeriaceae sp. PMI808]
MSTNPLRQYEKEQIVNEWFQRDPYLHYIPADQTMPYELTICLGDFLNIIRTNGSDTYMVEDIINISLCLLTEIKMGSDCLFLATFDARILCGLGSGKFAIDHVSQMLQDGLRVQNRRWVIVPCTDGFLDDDDTRKEREKKRKEKQKGTTVNNEGEVGGTRNADSAFGAHWGLMIIDTVKKVASWLDGKVDLGEDNKITDMFRAGEAAGKALCGYEMVLKLEHGEMNVRTLKYVPHQTNDNTVKGDGGACGPHMFACLKHIFENPEALENLHAHFKKNSRASGNFKRGKGRFNSLAIRREIQEMMRTRKENSENENVLPFGLTRPLLEILGLNISEQQISDAVNKFRGTASRVQQPSNIPNQQPLDIPNTQPLDVPGPLAALMPAYQVACASGVCDATGISSLEDYAAQMQLHESFGNDKAQAPENAPENEVQDSDGPVLDQVEEPIEPASNQNKDSVEPPSDQNAVSAKPSSNRVKKSVKPPSKPKEVPKGPSAKEDQGSKKEARSATKSSEPADSKSKGKVNPPKTKQATKLNVLIDGITYIIPRSDRTVLIRHRENRLSWPAGTSDQPLPDFSTLRNQQLQDWVNTVRRIVQDKKDNSNHNDTTSQAMLHFEYKRTFLTEPDVNFTNTWSRDTNVFPNGPDKKMPVDKIRHEVMKVYEPTALQRITQYAQNKRKNAEDDEGTAAKKPRTKIDPPKSVSNASAPAPVVPAPVSGVLKLKLRGLQAGDQNVAGGSTITPLPAQSTELESAEGSEDENLDTPEDDEPEDMEL